MSLPTWLRSLARTLGLRNTSSRRARREAKRSRWTGRHALGVEHLEARTLLSASVWTDKLDYAPGSTAIINGSGFLFTHDEGGNPVGEVVQLQVTRTDGVPDYPEGNVPWQVKDGDTSFTDPYKDADGMWHSPDLDGQVDGNIQTTWYVEPQYADSTLQLTATGLTSGEVATAEFTDGWGGTFSVKLNGGTPYTGSAGTPSNNGTSVTVGPGASITVDITATETSGAPGNWKSTGWRISTSPPGTVTIVDTADHGNGTATETITVTAPAAAGTYNLYLVLYDKAAGNCLAP